MGPPVQLPNHFPPAHSIPNLPGKSGWLLPPRPALLLALLTGALAFFGATVMAQVPAHLTVPQPGGVPGLPVMTGIERTSNGVSLTWYGPAGYYQLYQKLGLGNSARQTVGGLNFSNRATITGLRSNAFYRVACASPKYTGSQTCTECHAPIHDPQVLTPHAAAFTGTKFISLGGQTNSSCLPCHTVGAGVPTGFVSLSKTPKLAGVQCENCHGPAAVHAANPEDPTMVPRVELAAALCGGCHNAAFVPSSVAAYHPPRYEEWNTSEHRSVEPVVAAKFTTSSASIQTCGSCHSGTVREALMENKPLPGAAEAAAVGIACATCHDAHSLYTHTNVLAGVVTNVLANFTFTNSVLGRIYTNQLPSPFASFQPYHTTGAFATNYNPEINLCAQCHNDRGAAPADTDFPPHPSGQYNLLLGAVGVIPPGEPTNQPATHAFLEKQCAACHMQSSTYVSPSQPAVSGHSFEMASFNVCATCHGSALNSMNLASFLELVINTEVQTVNASLNSWAQTKAPVALRTKYGTRAWEYTSPGSLSPGGPGPTAAEQTATAVPTAIKQARHNLYLVVNDGSHGVHNPLYCLDLLNYANALVQQELHK